MIHWHVNPAPEAPFYASIFNYILSDNLELYDEYDQLTIQRVKTMSGFLGYEVMRDQKRGSFISYWDTLDSIYLWSNDPLHKKAKTLGQSQWYTYYHSEIVQVLRFHQYQTECKGQ
ncbi:MAG: antibiotic biosynthesis monooxygenase family protein [Bacteroidota bacterium]|jgi:heme-degrading monooxygenase HmoA